MDFVLNILLGILFEVIFITLMIIKVKDNEEMALKMTHSWLNDSDAKEGKLYSYRKYIIKRD